MSQTNGSLKLESLRIDLQPSYASNAGKYEGEIKYQGHRGEVKLLLDHAISERLLSVIGDAVMDCAHRASLDLKRSIEQSLIETRQPAIEAPKEGEAA